ncbi:MAG: cytochrome c3 family protein [Anaerolineaceae bacterium]|nr:cytochrome c3 family protein [Anaerolineaceae bacterium]
MTKGKVAPQGEPDQTEKGNKPGKRFNGLKKSVLASIVIVVAVALVLGGAAVMHQSNTNPNFCGLCHIMQPNVQSYLTSKNLDHVHEQAGVQCKDCHDYPISAEISSGIKFMTGSYTVDKNGQLTQRKFSDAMCTKCHISEQHVAQLTDFLARNPHDSHNGDLPCNTCHVSHGQQIDYCSQCHDNGGQRMIGGEIKPRGTINGN